MTQCHKNQISEPAPGTSQPADELKVYLLHALMWQKKCINKIRDAPIPVSGIGSDTVLMYSYLYSQNGSDTTPPIPLYSSAALTSHHHLSDPHAPSSRPLRARRASGAPDPAGPGFHLSQRAPALTFIALRGFACTLWVVRALDSLVRVTKWVADNATDPWRLLRGPRHNAIRAHWGQFAPVDSRTGGREPRHGAVKLQPRATFAPSLSKPT